MLTDDEILNAINDAPIAQGPSSFVLAIGRAIERKVLERIREQNVGSVQGYVQPASDAQRVATIRGSTEYLSWFPITPGDCIHCGKELCNDLGWCNSFKAAPGVKGPDHG